MKSTLFLRFSSISVTFPREAARNAKFQYIGIFVVLSDEIGRKSQRYFGKSHVRASRENCGKSCLIRRRNKSRRNVTPVPWRDVWFYLRGQTETGDDMSVKR